MIASHLTMRYGSSVSSTDPAVFRLSDSTFTKNNSGLTLYRNNQFTDRLREITVTRNTWSSSGGIRVESANDRTDPDTIPVQVKDNTVTGYTDSTPAFVLTDARLQPSHLTGNTGTSNTINAISINGNLVEDWTMPTTGLPYVTGYYYWWYGYGITVATNSTLTMPASVILKFYQGSLTVNNGGTLKATGTADQPVTFTSWRDDTIGGDTNNDSDSTKPTRGEWYGIYAEPGSTVTLDHALVRYSQQGVNTNGAATTSLKNTTIQNCSDTAVTVSGDTVDLDPLWAGGNKATGCTNWNGIRFNNLTLAKDATVHTNDDWDIAFANISVPDGKTLTVPAGQWLKFVANGLSIQNGGTLKATGTADQPVTFTSWRDDTIGGDTNNDSDSTKPTRGEWYGIYAEPGSTVTLDHALVRYSQQGVNTNGAATTSLKNTTIQNCSDTAVTVSGDTVDLDPLWAGGNKATGCTNWNGIRFNNLTLAKDATVHTNDDWDIAFANISVPDGKTLTVPAGQWLKFVANGLSIQNGGTLKATGTADQPVTFTSWRDDTIGGDTNNDSDSTKPTRGEWYGIYAEPGSTVTLDHALVRYSQQGVNTNGAATTSLKNTTIQNCSDTAVTVSGDTVDLDPLWAGGNKATGCTNWNGIRFNNLTLAKDATVHTNDDWDIAFANISVPDGKTLTVPAGQWLKFVANGLSIQNGGTLKATGTADQPVTFTSWRDDTIGGDTNNDSDSTKPTRGEWYGIYAEPGSTVTLDHALVRYSQQGVNTNGAATTGLDPGSWTRGIQQWLEEAR